MSQRRSARVKSQLEKVPEISEREPEPTIAPTLLYSPVDGLNGASPLKETPSLRRQATPFHEPHLHFTPSQNTLATLGAPLLPPLATPMDDIEMPIMALNSNQNERLLDEDPNETQRLMTPNKTSKTSKSSTVGRGELLSPLDPVSSPEDNNPSGNAKKKGGKEAESISEDGDKERLVPLSDENWRENLDSSGDLTSPTLTKKPKDKGKKSSQKVSPWKEREASEEIVSPKNPTQHSDEDFEIKIPTQPIPSSKPKDAPKAKQSPKSPLKTLKVVEVKRPISPSPFKSPPKPTPTPPSKKIIKKRKRDEEKDEEEKIAGGDARLTRKGSADIISISSLEDQRGAALKKRAITDYLDPNSSKSPFDADKPKAKQVIAKNSKAQESEDEDDFDVDAKPLSLPKARGGQKRPSRRSDSVGHTSASKKRKRDASSWDSEVESGEEEDPPSERRTSKRPRTAVVLSESSHEEEVEDEVIDEEESLANVRTNLFKKERKAPKESDVIDVEELLEVDYARFLQEDDTWFLYEANDFEPVSNTHARSRLFNGCTFIFSGLSLRPDTPSDVPSLIDSLTRIVKAFGGKVGEAAPTKLFAEEIVLEEGEDEDDDGWAEFSRPNCFLLAPTHLRTAKYLQALALGVPCIHYSWLLHCYHFNRFVDPNRFLLKAGVSAAGKVVGQSLRLFSDFPKNELSFLFFNNAVLDSYRVEVTGENDFKKSIEGIARAAGAKIVSRLLGPYQKDSHIDFVISDPRPSKLICASAAKKGLTLLSREWLIQCLVRNVLLSEEDDDAFLIPNPLTTKKR